MKFTTLITKLLTNLCLKNWQGLHQILNVPQSHKIMSWIENSRTDSTYLWGTLAQPLPAPTSEDLKVVGVEHSCTEN